MPAQVRRRVLVIGASGYIGSRVTRIALSRGHEVTAVARNTVRIRAEAGLTVRSFEIGHDENLAGLFSGHDAVASCYNPGGHDPAPHYYRDIVENTRLMIEAANRAGVGRFVYVGGVGSLFVKPGLRLVDDPDFFRYLSEAPEGTLMPSGPPLPDIPLAARIAYYLFEREKDLDWTFISPAMFLGQYPERSGRIVYGGDDVLRNEDGSFARLDVDDLARAVVDELDGTQHHSRRRIAVASV